MNLTKSIDYYIFTKLYICVVSNMLYRTKLYILYIWKLYNYTYDYTYNYTYKLYIYVYNNIVIYFIYYVLYTYVLWRRKKWELVESGK